MPTDMSTSLALILLGLVAFVLAVWVLTRLNRKAKVIEDGSTPTLARDVLDEGAARAQRNQALIDAAPAAVKETPPTAHAPLAEPAPVAAPKPTPAPATATATAPMPEPTAPTVPASSTTDDLARIKGLGPKLVALLGELGVTNYAQIAAWTDADVTRIDAQLGRFKGRITRDQWIEQAKLLAAREESAFVAQFGSNG